VIHRERCIVLDVDGTLCPIKREDEDYSDLSPCAEVVARMREYRAHGFYLILQSSRNMNRHDGNMGLITAHTARTMLDWLDRHEIPYDELHLGKPWAGRGGFYVDDRAIRPSEFVSMSYEEVLAVIDLPPAETGGR
jgi:capsule biosynthesis phosphatase